MHCIATEPTFFGNYAPPDDLDGQIIDLVSLSDLDDDIMVDLYSMITIIITITITTFQMKY